MSMDRHEERVVIVAALILLLLIVLIWGCAGYAAWHLLARP